MRQLLSLSASVALTVSVVACGPSAASTTRLQPAGEFRVLVPSRPSTLNPDLHLDEVALLVGRSIFNHLLSLNETGRLLPELAESWTTSADGLTYTFKLRQGVRWHDGAAFTAADVRWTLETLATDGFGGRDALAPVQSIATPDPLTVVITLKHPWAPFAGDLAGPGLSILPRHLYATGDWRTNPANDRPVGTGPFKFDRWIDDGTLVLTANPQYFRSGPYVQRIVFEPVPSDEVTERLVSGRADYSVTRPASVDVHAPPEPLVIRTLPTSGRYYLAMNLRRAPFNDVRVRRALANAIDRLEIVSTALAGLGAPAIGWYTPDVQWAYNSAVQVPEYDRDQARRLLDAAGLRMKNGKRFHATLLVPNASPMTEIAELLRTQLASVGVDLTVERLPITEWPKRTVGAHDFDLTIVSGGQGPDPDHLRRRFLADTETGAYIGYDDPDFRQAVERGARVTAIAARAAAYYRAQEVLARDVPFIPLAEAVKLVVFNRRVSGLPQLEARGLVGMFDFSLVKLGAPRAATIR
jgi:peptide/nickel transport system substrate-binding protein